MQNKLYPTILISTILFFEIEICSYAQTNFNSKEYVFYSSVKKRKKAPILSVSFTNNTDSSFIWFGNSFILERKYKNKWRRFKLKHWFFEETYYRLSPHTTNLIDIDFNQSKTYFPSGKYRYSTKIRFGKSLSSSIEQYIYTIFYLR